MLSINSSVSNTADLTAQSNGRQSLYAWLYCQQDKDSRIASHSLGGMHFTCVVGSLRYRNCSWNELDLQHDREFIDFSKTI
ncbi:hypothetical protein V6x_54380 [Gimesia chilikensis]|uniref:Uncharacterized protein n=1 Tax=Gimesia chilikensis TaxID=2605989 RepID=A0A517WKB6_9PLAN|nr:hypothetical protein V6x_54380 [Gimesia chilikensis]